MIWEDESPEQTDVQMLPKEASWRITVKNKPKQKENIDLV